MRLSSSPSGCQVEFVSPDEADNEHPLIAAEDKLEALSSLTDVEQNVNEAMSTHNMIKSLKEYKALADQITEMREDHQKSLQKLKDSEQCSLNYIGRYFSTPVKTWSGVPLGDNVNRHDLRKGISGWAVEAFETAKAAETSVVGAEDIAQPSLNAEAQTDLADDPDMKKAEAQSQNTGITINASKQEESQEENRRSSLIAWQIGAEAAKMLGSNADEWGTPSGRSFIWNDTRNFYTQYLRRKYENVKSYLKSYTKDDVLALIIAKLRGQDVDITETNYQKKVKEAVTKASSDAAAASLAQYDSQTQARLQSLQKQREELIAKMDAVNDIVSGNRNTIADMRSVAEDSAAQEVDEKINAKILKNRGFNPSISTKLMKEEAEQGLEFNIKKFKNLAPEAVKDLEFLKANQAKYKKLIGSKILAETAIPIALMGFIIPKLIFAWTANTKKELAKKKEAASNKDTFTPAQKNMAEFAQNARI